MSENNVVNLASKAQACLGSGHLEEARSLLERLCGLDKQNEENWLMLAAVHGETGRLDEALSCANRAIELDGAYVEAYLTRAHLLLKLTQPEKALQSALKAVEIDDEYTEAWLFLAGIAGQLERYEDAEQWARKALRLAPDNIDALVNRANAQYRQDDPETENSYRQVLQIQPDNVPARMGLARSLMAQERFGDAEDELRHVLKGAPNEIEALDALGLCCMKMDRLDEAAAIFEDVIQRDTGHQQGYLHLAELLDMRGDYHGAMQCLEQAQTMVTQPLDVIAALVSLYHVYGMHYQAIGLCDEALKMYPDNFDIRYYRVLSLADFGRFDEALDGVKALKSEEPGEVKLIGTHASLLERMGNYDAAHEMILPYINEQKIPGSIVTTFMRLCHRYDECDQAEILVNILLAKPELNPELRRGLLFNLVKLKDRLGYYDEAFAFAREANELKPCQYDHAQYVDYIDRILDPVILSLSEEPLIPVTQNESVRPVFIVGMPRSGTSLVEQIIATHPLAYGGGERHAISSIVSSLPGWLGNVAEYPECLAAVSPDTIEQILASYTRFTEKLPEGTRVMTDKMPENFQHLVLIRMLFPDSRIIHCVRDPIDTCLSCYLQQFTGYHEYAYDLGNLGRHYREYQRLMKHYRDDAGIHMLEVKYEELVNNTEEVSRSLVEYCGLEWDDRCLKFYELDRIVHTASYDQVKEPVYTRSVGRWKNYEKYLQPLTDALKD